MKNISHLIIYKQFNLILFLLIPLFFTSCFNPEEEITWDLKNHSPMLVIDGLVTNEFKNHNIRLTLTNPYFSTDEPQPVHGALVRISDGINNFTFSESSDNNGLYLSDEPFAGESGKTYELFITLTEEIGGQTEFFSSSTMPEGLNIDSVICEIYDLPDIISEETNAEEKDTTALVVVYFGQEPISRGNYYYASILRNNTPLFSNIKSYPFADDSERNGDYTNVMTCFKNVADKDTITFNLFSIDKAYYRYIEAISKIDQTGNIYSPQGPPANAVGNVNGALGYFAAAYVSKGEAFAVYME